VNGFELPRRNRALAHEERWQPPPFVPATTPRERLQAAARRLLDLQAASIWNDLRCLLEGVEGDVVDVGAGAQPYRRLLSGRVHYRAIDVGLAGAFGYQQPDTDYFEGSHWPLEDASVDLVLSTEVLEHVLDPAAFLAEARRVLRPGARLLLTVPFAARWHYIPHDYWRYTPSSLSNLLATAGFGEVCVYARGNELTVACAKVIGLVLPALLPARRNALSQFARLGAIVCAPLVFIVAAIGQLSLRGQGGDDCLGYTVTARVSPQEIAAAG
jgi:SAM-dependent methyltransferase